MDVSLVLTHRCNLNCGYCYAGEHTRRDMDDAIAHRAVDLLVSDSAPVAQLSFFGGEPFLAFDAMRRATDLAKRRCDESGTQLLLQCTTNGTVLRDEHVKFIKAAGMRVTVSIDGVREAHELHRPMAGGKSSFDNCHRGLRKLLSSGAAPDAMMVISPQTVPYVYRSVSWLWGEGVRVVRANIVLDADWEIEDKRELREQLHAVSFEMLDRRLQGERASFEPFEQGIQACKGDKRARRQKRIQVVVATSGNLYPCAPMVGEDLDTGREASVRIGHLSDGADAIAARLKRDGAGCGDGKGCACAAYLETGDRTIAGPVGLWYADVCEQMGAAVAQGLRASKGKPSRRRMLLGGLAAASGLAAGVLPAMLQAGLGGDEPRVHTLGALVAPAEAVTDEPLPLPDAVPEPIVEPELPPPPPVPGGLAPPPPEPEPEVEIEGRMAPPPRPEIHTRGSIARPAPEPPPEPEIEVDGDIL